MAKSTWFGWVLAIVLLIGAVSTSNATVFRNGDRISIGEGTTIDDEVYAFGQSIVVGGKLASDLTAAASDIRVSEQGSVGGSANLAGSILSVAGKVTSNLRAAGSQVTVSARVGKNAALAGSDVMLAGAGVITLDLFAVGNTVDIEGSVGRNLQVAATTATINGPVGGDVSIDANQVNIGPDAVIRGNLTYTSLSDARIDPGAQILGKTTRAERKNEFGPLKWFVWAIGFMALFVAGLVALALAPVAWGQSAELAFGKPWQSMLIGFILLVVVPIAALMLVFTVFGIPMALIILGWYFLLLYISRIVIALAIGRWMLTRGGRPEPSRFLAFFVGLLIYWLLTAIPSFGTLISFVGLLLSVGAFAWNRYTFVRQLRAENKL